MKAQNSYDLEHCYELLELANGAKPSDVERNWKALSEVYDSNRFIPGSTSHTICAKKMQMISYAYKKIKSAMRHYDQNTQDTSCEDMLTLRRQAASGDNGAAYRLAFMLEEGMVCREDLQNAAYWYALAAKRGHLESQFKWAKRY